MDTWYHSLTYINVSFALSILMGWIPKRLAVVAVAAVLAWPAYSDYILSMVSLLPVLWAMAGRFLVHVPRDHYMVVSTLDECRVLSAGIHPIWPWEWIDTRLTGGNHYCTRQTLFVYTMSVYDDAVDTISLGFKMGNGADPLLVLPDLYAQLAQRHSTIRAVSRNAMTVPAVVAMQGHLNGIGLPGYLTPHGLGIHTKPNVIDHTATARRRGSIGRRS